MPFTVIGVWLVWVEQTFYLAICFLLTATRTLPFDKLLTCFFEGISPVGAVVYVELGLIAFDFGLDSSTIWVYFVHKLFEGVKTHEFLSCHISNDVGYGEL